MVLISVAFALMLCELVFYLEQASAESVETRLKDAAGNATTLNNDTAPTWTNSPSWRGTADILWSCIVTLTACVYTAIHPNVPDSRRSKSRRLGVKMKWALIALVAPELVLHTAIEQYRAPQRVCERLNCILREVEDKDNVATCVLKESRVRNPRFSTTK